MGWGDFFGGIGKILGKGSTYIQSRIEKLKNEKESLEREKAKLLDGGCDEKKANRVRAINERINVINQLLATKAQDD